MIQQSKTELCKKKQISCPENLSVFLEEKFRNFLIYTNRIIYGLESFSLHNFNINTPTRFNLILKATLKVKNQNIYTVSKGDL